MNDAETAAKGRRAASELRETEEAFATLRQRLLDEIAATSPGQPDKVLKLHMSVQNLTAVKTALMLMVQAGQVADAAMAQSGLNRA